MAKRPQNLDLNAARGHDRLPSRTRPNFHMDLPSPRAGEIPPALSPLDAFALHSRALARKLEESSKAGRRMSRLPHQDIADELAKRPGYFRSVSSGVESLYDEDQEEDDDDDEADETQWQGPRLQAQTPNGAVYRPVSHYPMLGNVVRDDQEVPSVPEPIKEADTEHEEKGYFGIEVPRSSSPEPFDSRNIKTDEASPALPSLTSSIDSIQSSQPRTLTNESSRRQDNNLAPPRSPVHPRSARSIASIRSVIDSAEEDNGSPSGSLEVGPSRKVRTPFSPEMLPVSRSPSNLSDYSVSSDLPRPSFNFSRPRGNSLARPGADNNLTVDTRRAVERQPSNDSTMSQPTRSANSTQTMRVRAPVDRQNSDSATDVSGALSDKDFFSGEETPVVHPGPGAPSYVYSKYSLPRGRMLDRDSVEARSSWAQHQIKWEQQPTGLEPKIAESPLPSPNLDNPMLSPGSGTPRGQSPSPGSARERSTEHPAPSPSRLTKKTTPQTPSIASESTNRTIRAGSHIRNSPSTDIAGLSPEQHLEKGIECHSSGSLSKSTYHLRLAARAGLPTGMLLYALACRHGWGMRPNQAEGVSWLRRAVDSAGVEFIEDSSNDGSQAVSKEQKARKAQFALAIYELGMSYMNGWGIPKDKPLAVRCFEIAGSWGDTDALAEAGFCYTQGVGCRKDLKKAAEFYRQAADKGMSMAGNSWIYKPKYMPDPPPREETPEPVKKSRGRSRTLFGRKKAAPAS